MDEVHILPVHLQRDGKKKKCTSDFVGGDK